MALCFAAFSSSSRLKAFRFRRCLVPTTTTSLVRFSGHPPFNSFTPFLFSLSHFVFVSFLCFQPFCLFLTVHVSIFSRFNGFAASWVCHKGTRIYFISSLISYPFDLPYSKFEIGVFPGSKGADGWCWWNWLRVAQNSCSVGF